MNTRGLMNYIEDIRYGRNMTQEELLDGIISRRQYQRYRNDESYVPLDIVEKLSKRLGISSKKLMFEFESEALKQSDEIKKFYNLVIGRNLDEASKLEKEIKEYTIIDDERAIDFECAMKLKDFYLNRISLPELLRNLSKMINYPDILKKDVITDGEALILGVIQEYSEPDRVQIIEKLEKLIVNIDMQVSGANVFAHQQLMFNVAKYYGRVRQFDKVEKYCNIGISICVENRTYYLMEYFTYYKALAMLRTGQEPDFEEYLARCGMTLLMEQDQDKIKRFEHYFMKDFGINLYQFLLTHLDEKVRP